MSKDEINLNEWVEISKMHLENVTIGELSKLTEYQKQIFYKCMEIPVSIRQEIQLLKYL